MTERAPLRLTILESATERLSKAYEWTGGALEKTVAPPLYKGTARSVTITGLRQFATMIDGLPERQALALCNSERSTTTIVTARNADPFNATIARTLEHFAWDPNAQALMLFDVDTAGYTPEEVWKIIRGLDPAFANAAGVGRYSTSSFISGPDGFATGAKGVHLFVPVAHPQDMQKAGKTLAKRLWLAGRGYIGLTNSGRLLVRQLIDASVWSPERLVYEVSPSFAEGLTQERPPAEVFKGDTVDLSAVTALTEAEEAEYARLVVEAKAAKMPEADRVFEEYLEAKAHELGVSVGELEPRWRALGPKGKGEADIELPDEYILDLGSNGRMTVKELINVLNGGAHIKGNFPDPIEGPMYGGTCAYVQREKTRGGHWRIYSQAHGGIAYVLGREADDVEQVDDPLPPIDVAALASVVRALIPKLQLDAGALFDSPAARDALLQIRRADRGEWVRLRKELLGTRAFKAEELDGWLETDRAGETDATAADDDEAKPDLITSLVTLVKSKATLGYEDEHTGVVVVTGEGRRRVHRLPSDGFDIWLRGLYYAQTQRGISDATLRTAAQTVLAACVASGNRVETHVRVAKGPDEAYYIDLCDDAGRAVRVTAGAWNVVPDPPVLFFRPRDALALPEPRRLPEHWSVALTKHLLAHLNLAATETVEDRLGNPTTRPSRDPLLLLAFMLDALRPDTPFPVLEIDGEQGSAKSDTQKRIRDIIDPHAVPLRGRPKTVEDIYVAARNNHVISFENISSLTADQQDALCSLSTGAGHAGRALYTNSDEFSITAKRPVIINGIGAAATRPDLIDRVVHLELPAISDSRRRTERELNAAWAQSRPLAFSGLIQCFAESLAQLPNVHLTKRPRMADFAELGAALALAMGGRPTHFLGAFEKNRAAGHERAIETFPVGAAVLDLLAEKASGFDGPAGALFDVLRPKLANQENAPRSPRGMSGQLKRVAPALKARGVDVTWGGHTRTGNRITIRWTPQPSTPPVVTQPQPSSAAPAAV